MAKQIIVTQGDTGIELSVQFVDDKKKPIDITGKEIEVNFVNPNEEVYETMCAQIVDGTQGIASIILTNKHTSITDLHKTYWACMDDNGYVTAQTDLFYYVKEKLGGIDIGKEQDGSLDADSTIEKIKDIDNSINSIKEEIEDIKKVNSSTEDVLKNTENISKNTEDILKNTENISALKNNVNKINSLVENIIDVKLLPDYDTDDISKVFNSITYKSGYTYILDIPECNCRHMIDITLPERTTLIIKSFVNCYDSFMRLRLGQGCKIVLDYIKAVNENVYDRGLHLVKGSDSEITIGKIQGFLTSVAYRPLVEWDWIQFMKLNFFDITGDVGLELAVPNENCWVNENTFNGGGFGGRINIWLHKIFDDKNYRSLINNNKFYNIALQSKEECILIDSGETNYFYNLRTWEQDEYHQGELYINDNGGSNYFECLHAIQYDKLKLGSDSKFDGQLFAPWDVSTDSFPLVCYSAVGDRDKTKPIVKTPICSDVNCNRNKGYFHLNTVTKKVIANMGDAEIFTVFLDTPLFFRTNNFYFRKAGYNNGTQIRLETPTGKSVTLIQNGLYLVSLGDSYDYFEVYKVSEGDPITSS